MGNIESGERLVTVEDFEQEGISPAMMARILGGQALEAFLLVKPDNA